MGHNLIIFWALLDRATEAGPIAWVEASLVIAIIIRRKIVRFSITTAAGTTKKEHKKIVNLYAKSSSRAKVQQLSIFYPRHLAIS